MQTGLNKLFLLLSFFMFGNIYAQCDLPENTLAINGLDIWYKIAISIGGFIFATLLCYWFGHFMSSGERDWN